MKIRDGFVSNSSSSSFVLAIEKDKNPTARIELNVRLDAMIDRVLINGSDLDEYFDSTYYSGWRNNKDIIEKYNKILSRMMRGDRIYILIASSDTGDAVEYMIYEKSAKILKLENCELLYGDEI